MAQATQPLTGPLKLVIIGGSAGSLEVVIRLLAGLSAQGTTAYLLVLHRNAAYESALHLLLQSHTSLPVAEAEDKTPLLPDHIYVAPPNYHVLAEHDGTLALDNSEKVNHSRPSIDVAFESGAEAYGQNLLCVLLSGASADGAAGLHAAWQLQATCAVQHPEDAVVDTMPLAALKLLPAAAAVRTAELPALISRFASH